MVDTLVSGASASRRVGSTPISGTVQERLTNLVSLCFFIPTIQIDSPLARSTCGLAAFNKTTIAYPLDTQRDKPYACCLNAAGIWRNRLTDNRLCFIRSCRLCLEADIRNHLPDSRKPIVYFVPTSDRNLAKVSRCASTLL